MSAPGFWDDSEKAQALINRNNAAKETYDQFQAIANETEELNVMWEMQQEEFDSELQKELEEGLVQLQEKVSGFELSLLLDEPYDKNNAILELHPGAGGTESQDWGSMLLRMYTRWAEQHGFSVETIDYQAGDEAGIKSVTLMIKGTNAYGYLKSEKGVHRLVRISPFDSASRRHTSFCSVEVMPELDENIEIEINPDDLKVDVYRASGAGGQHINKTESAVRITHLPTGLVVECQDERSQHKNKDKAMKILRSRLYDMLEQERNDKIASDRRSQVGTGSRSERIRTYNFPEGRLTDHRIGLTIYRLEYLLNGNIDEVIDALATADQAAKLSAQGDE